MKLKALSTAILLTALAVGSAQAGAVRVAPIRIAPVILPGVGSLVMPLNFPFQGPTLPFVLPSINNPQAPFTSLPGVKMPVVQPTPIEQPNWPTMPIRLPSAALKASPAKSPISKRIDTIRKKLRLDTAQPNLDAAFDGSKNSDGQKDNEVTPARPSIDWPSRPVTLPEDDLLRELGL